MAEIKRQSPPKQNSFDIDLETKKQSMQESGASNIMVAVRSRPYTKKDAGSCLAEIIDDKIVVLQDPEATSNRPEKAFRVNRISEKHYAFDYAFGQNATQVEVFDKTTRFLLDGVVNGFNATVFAYGATGAGKTYTMMGTVENPGIMLLTVRDLFNSIKKLQNSREFQVKLSYIEIYNETIRDLINVSLDLLDIREDPIRGNVVAGISEVLVTSPDEIFKKLRDGNQNRTTESTGANETSSRSHAVLQIIVEHRQKANIVGSEVIVGKLNMIDLAGSERASKTQNRGIRLIEGANINRSLLALGNCINALYEANEKGGRIFIPYRDSKLTRLLKDSLGGNCRTVMIANISPFYSCYEDTSNTLKYANRAKNIKTHVKRNVENVDSHINNYASIIEKLKEEIQDLRNQLNDKQVTGTLPPIPITNVENTQIEINKHFANEAQARKRILEIEQNIQQIGFVIYNRQLELAQKKEADQDTSLRNELDILKNTVSSYEINLDRELTQLNQIEQEREPLKAQWSGSEIPENVKAQLNLTFNQNVIAMENLNLQRKENKAETMIKQKDLYIQCLQNQLQLRDKIINDQRSLFKEKNIDASFRQSSFVNLQNFEEIEELNFAERILGSPQPPRQSPGESLPPIRSQTRIPRPTMRQQPSTTRKSPTKEMASPSPTRSHPKARTPSHSNLLNGIKSNIQRPPRKDSIRSDGEDSELNLSIIKQEKKESGATPIRSRVKGYGTRNPSLNPVRNRRFVK